MNKRVIGSDGEKMAVDFLTGQGIEIIEMNYTTKLGEIDIIAKEQGTTIFIEVKYRKSDKMGRPFESVNYGKQMKIQRVAMLYAQKYNTYEKPMRFDVIEIIDSEITWLKNSFEMKNNFRYL